VLALARAALDAAFPRFHPDARSGSSGRRSSKAGTRGARDTKDSPPDDVEDGVEDLAQAMDSRSPVVLGSGQMSFET
jgi:hypothetical protein